MTEDREAVKSVNNSKEHEGRRSPNEARRKVLKKNKTARKSRRQNRKKK